MKEASLTLLLLLCAAQLPAQTLNLQATPQGASIYALDVGGRKTLLGTGTAKFKLEKEAPNQVVVEAEGFQPLVRTFDRGAKYPKIVPLELTHRLVKVSALPYDAQIYLNGSAVGRQSAEIVVESGKSATVELKKPGYRSVTRTYSNIAGADLPPVLDQLRLADRVVAVTALPSGASIEADGSALGETSGDVVVPRDKCVTAKVVKSGFAPLEKVYCNKDASPEPPLTESFTLRDRISAVNVTPANAQIVVNGREVGSGSFSVIVPAGTCAEVIVRADGFVGERKNYCNEDNMPAPPLEEHFQLTTDEAYESSIKSDQANVNFTIEVAKAKTPEDAWKLISQIVLSHFDVLEITDKDTGYLRTSWVVNNFRSNTIRTRVIVKLGDTAPLKYVVKIASEQSGAPATSVKDDEKFREWDRILNSYKDLINEMQARLR